MYEQCDQRQDEDRSKGPKFIPRPATRSSQLSIYGLHLCHSDISETNRNSSAEARTPTIMTSWPMDPARDQTASEPLYRLSSHVKQALERLLVKYKIPGLCISVVRQKEGAWESGVTALGIRDSSGSPWLPDVRSHLSDHARVGRGSKLKGHSHSTPSRLAQRCLPLRAWAY